MKKRLFKVLAMVFLVPVLLTGCLTLVRSSYKEFEAVETDLSLWGFYGFLDNGKQNILTEYENLRGTNKNGYDELYDYLDNQKPLYNILRVGMTAVDLKKQTGAIAGAEAYFDFEDMKNYSIKRQGTTDRYIVKFRQAVAYNNFPNRDFTVDNILERLYFNYTIEVAVGSVGSSRDQHNITIRSYAIEHPSNDEIASAKEDFEKDLAQNGTGSKYVLESKKEGNFFELTAARIDLEENIETSRYEKTVRYTTGANISVKLTYNDGFGLKTKEKRLPVVNPVSGFTVSYNESEGFLGWDLTYSFGGEIKYSGESYFQGNKKFILKEIVDVATPNAMSFASSLVSEIKFDGEDFALKALKGSRTSSLKTQNILKVGLYDSEPQAYVFSKDRTLRVASFQKFG